MPGLGAQLGKSALCFGGEFPGPGKSWGQAGINFVPQTPAGTACDAERMVKESRVTAQFLQAYHVWVPPCTQVKGIFVSTPTALLAPAVSSGKGERDTSDLIYSSQDQWDSYFWASQDIPWFVLNQWVVPSATQLHLHTLNSVANWRGCMNLSNPVAISRAPQWVERLEGRKSFLNEKQTLIPKLPSFTTFRECLNGHLWLCASWFTNCIKLHENLSLVGFCSPKCWLLKVHYLRSEGLERPALSIHFMYWH